ncbi:hypothetical protein [Paenibacillus sp. N3.4]|uniref:hypothetical protein n=1 Tax=Paenibacillus sp. N3.4 TaxID=2603222 RepID=UPI0011CC96DD|nr:hypothetical protein [Paenibacillus sp. N3.4]TXK70153.1 hypothetical protein FU659_33805 [Paenibacillus sp. N3.4]
MSKEKLALDVILETSAGLLSLIPGAGLIVGPVKSVVSDYATRQLSKREEFRVGEVAQYCILKIKEKCAAGESLRDDDFFFDYNENYRSNAEEVFEGVLTKCKSEHEEKKSKYTSNIFVNVSFNNTSIGDANHYLKLASSITFRQMCLINIFGKNHKNELGIRSSHKHTFTSEQSSIYQEIYDLVQKGVLWKISTKQSVVEGFISSDMLLNSDDDYDKNVYSWMNVIPGRMALSGFGRESYELMGLIEIPNYELDELIQTLKY